MHEVRVVCMRCVWFALGVCAAHGVCVVYGVLKERRVHSVTKYFFFENVILLNEEILYFLVFFINYFFNMVIYLEKLLS